MEERGQQREVRLEAGTEGLQEECANRAGRAEVKQVGAG